uniref:Transcription factor bHLH36 n=1 Tax=Anthurium amnicola TaxID=1678845 RepID=A0A1D1XPQ3_9ARAE
MKKSSGEGPKVERKTVEKNRRIHMKNLCFKLSSLIPKGNIPKDALTQQDHLDQAAVYIKALRERIDGLKQRKEFGLVGVEGVVGGVNGGDSVTEGMVIGFGLPVVEIRDLESTLEVVLICGLDKRFLFYEVIGVLEEEGAEVVNASFSTVGDKIFYTIHSQVSCPRIGLEASRVSERLKELVHET